jgi:hypothetical protein
MMFAEMKSMKRFFTLLALVLLLAACNDASRDPVIKDYRIQQVGGLAFGLNGLTADMMLDLDIENPSRARYVVEALHATLFPVNDTMRFADIYLKEATAIPPKSDGTVSIPLDVHILKPLSLLSGALSDDLSKYEADVDLTIRKGSLKKTVRKQRVPLERIAELIGSARTQETNESNE